MNEEQEEISLVGRMRIELVSSGSLAEQEARLHTQHGPRGSVPHSPLDRERGKRKKTRPRLLSDLGHDRGTDRNRRASATLSPVLVHFLEPYGKLYLRLQVRVPENESVHLLATPPPRTLASSINIPDALFPGAAGANGHPKEPAQGYYRGLALRQIGAG